MAEIVSFKSRVKTTLIECAKGYQKYYLEHNYLICSCAFHEKKYYIVQANETNFLHLTGVGTDLTPKEFFTKCMKGSLTEEDFDFFKKGKTEKEVIGSVRRKIKALPYMMNLWTDTTLVEEDFKKNTINCSFAAGNSFCTLGFSITSTVKPKSLLKGNELDLSKADSLLFVLRSSNKKSERSI